MPIVTDDALQNNYLWIGTKEGLIKLNLSNYSKEVFTIQNSGLPSNEITCLERSDNLYIGTNLGLVSYTPEWKLYTKSDGLLSNKVKAVEKADGSIFFATDRGLSVFSNERWKNYNTPSILSLKYISPYLYLGVMDGLYQFDLTPESITKLLETKPILAIEDGIFLATEDGVLKGTDTIIGTSSRSLLLKDNLLYIGTQRDGVYLYDLITGSITAMNLPSPVYCIVIGDRLSVIGSEICKSGDIVYALTKWIGR